MLSQQFLNNICLLKAVTKCIKKSRKVYLKMLEIINTPNEAGIYSSDTKK